MKRKSSTSGNSLFTLASFNRTVHQELVNIAFRSPRHKSGPAPKKLSHWLCHTPYHSRWTPLMNTRALNSRIFYFCSLLKSTDPQCPIRYFMYPSVNYLASVFRNLSTAATLNSLASVLIMEKKSYFDPFAQGRESVLLLCSLDTAWICVLLLKVRIFFCNTVVTNTNPEEWRVALSIVPHGKVVRLWPQDLHNVLIELGLFLLQRERDKERGWGCVQERGEMCTVCSCGSFISLCQWQSYPQQNAGPLRVIDAEKNKVQAIQGQCLSFI